MQVAQRGTSATGVNTSGYFTADRWSVAVSNLGEYTQSLENDAPTGSGFRKSLKMLCTTADATPAAGGAVNFRQSIEGQNLQAVRKGTSSAQQLTMSFWVKSNVTGTYIAELVDNDNTRGVSAAYTINSSGTWEKKTIVFPADTTGAFDNDNNGSLQVTWWLGAGSDRTSGTLQTSWASRVNANVAVGQTNLAAATNNYWQITGVQLEVGAVATPFEFKPREQELAECQRYYNKSYRIADAPGTAAAGGQEIYFINNHTSATHAIYQTVYLNTQMRTDPTVTIYSSSTGASGKVRDVTAAADINAAPDAINEKRFHASYTVGSSTTINAQWHWVASAEL
jgi:phage gp37-like protein